MSSHTSSSPLPPIDADPPRRVRVHHLKKAKEHGQRLTMLTAYDTPTARIFDDAGIDMLLVGDSYADNMLGFDSTLPVTVEEMIPAVRAVARGARRAMIVADLPFGTYELSAEVAFSTAVRMMKEGGAQAVKVEGGFPMVDHVETLTTAGIPVVGHLGFTPQSENVLGGRRVQGRGENAGDEIRDEALALQNAGAIAIVLEMVPAPIAAQVTSAVDIPTIGIGAGPDCDGQVLVWLDLAGMGDWSPRFAKRYLEMGRELTKAAQQYASEVRSGAFPSEEYLFKD